MVVVAGAPPVEAGGWVAGDGAGLVAGTGAPLPAVSEPSPSLLMDNASIFPVTGKPFLSWNFDMASAVAASHLPVGSPW